MSKQTPYFCRFPALSVNAVVVDQWSGRRQKQNSPEFSSQRYKSLHCDRRLNIKGAYTVYLKKTLFGCLLCYQSLSLRVNVCLGQKWEDAVIYAWGPSDLQADSFLLLPASPGLHQEGRTSAEQLQSPRHASAADSLTHTLTLII